MPELVHATLPLLDSDRDEGPQWRVCSASLTVDHQPGRSLTKAFLRIVPDPLDGGASCAALLASPAFLSVAAGIVLDPLTKVAPGLLDGWGEGGTRILTYITFQREGRCAQHNLGMGMIFPLPHGHAVALRDHAPAFRQAFQDMAAARLATFGSFGPTPSCGDDAPGAPDPAPERPTLPTDVPMITTLCAATLPLLHGDRDAGPQWRSCTLRVELDHDADGGVLSAGVRISPAPAPNGASEHDLIHSPAFVAAAARFVHGLFLAGFPAMFLHLDPDDGRRQLFSIFDQMGSVQEGPDGAQRIAFPLPRAHVAELCKASSHARVAFARAAEDAACAQRALARRFGPTTG